MRSMKCLPDERLACVSHDGSVSVWSPDGRSAPEFFDYHGGEGDAGVVTGVSWSRDNDLVSAGRDGKLLVWYPHTGTGESIFDE